MDWNREEDFEEWLEPSGKHRLRIIQRYAGGMDDFVVVYHYHRAATGRPVEIACYDRSHGFAHRDLRYLAGGDKRQKKALDGRTVSEQYLEALSDARRNWLNFFLEYQNVNNE